MKDQNQIDPTGQIAASASDAPDVTPVELGGVSRAAQNDFEDLEPLTGSSIGGTVESYTATRQKGMS